MIDIFARVGGVTDSSASTAAPPGLRDIPIFQVYKCGWWFEQRVEHALATLGIRGRHLMVLTMLQASDDLSQQQMATYMSLDPTLMVALIDELERQGLCERTRDPGDRRRYLVRITAAGRRLFRKGRSIIDEIQADILSPLTEGERETVADAMTRVMEPYWSEKIQPPRRQRP
jgi:DNA-binding MarR family transcriptional regulator